METISQTETFIHNWFDSLGEVIEETFVRPIDQANSEIILNRAKTKNIDVKKIVLKIKALPENQWSTKVILEFLNEFNSEIGISDEFIKKQSIQQLSPKDLQETKWELLKRIIVDYAKFTKELYDNLKYSENTTLSYEKRRLMYDLMKALHKIHESSKDLIDRYECKTYNANSFRKYVDSKIAIDHLLLRIYYILLHIGNTDKLHFYGKVLSTEVTEFSLYQKK